MLPVMSRGWACCFTDKLQQVPALMILQSKMNKG